MEDAEKNEDITAQETEITGKSAYNGKADSDPGPVSQLMGLDGIFGPGDMGTEPATDREIQILREQLRKLPPEVAFQGKLPSDNDACKLCWSIIYRPLIKAGNL